MSDRICSVEGCSSKHLARGRCGKHYNQWRHQTLAFPPCSVEGCATTSETAGMCSRHYGAYRRGGGTGSFCTVDGCGNGLVAKGLCSTHYAMWKRTGDPESTSRRGNPGVPRVAVVSYRTLHDRLKAWRGRAVDFPCVDCGETADEWSYVGHNGLVDPDTGMEYSLDLSDYEPRCRSCHRRFDHRR